MGNFALRSSSNGVKLLLVLATCFSVSLSQLSAQPETTTGTVASEVPANAADVNPLKVGDQAANATVLDADAKPVALADVYSSAPTVLIFYRGGWCPYCTAHLGKLATIEDELASAGYQIVAVTPDAPQFVKETAQRHKLNYLLLSDSAAAAARAFGLAFRVDDETVSRYLTFKEPIDLEKRAGEKHHILPVPAAYVIDRQGVIRYAYYSPDYKSRVDEQALLKAALTAK